MGKIILCVDTQCASTPAMLGLEDVNFDSLEWLEVITDAAVGRERVSNLSQTNGVDEVWIASTDDMAAVNLAAALRKDDHNVDILLVLFEANGSLLSRLQAAGITGSLPVEAFAKRFAVESIRRQRMQDMTCISEESLVQACIEIDEPKMSKSSKRAKLPKESLSQDLPQVVEHGQKGSEEMQAEHKDSAVSRDARAHVITVISGSGGAGKSTVAAVAACVSHAKGLKTLLLDCDLQFGDMHNALGVEKPMTIDEALADETLIPRLALSSGESGQLAVLAAPMRLEHSEGVSSHVGVLVEQCSGSFDVIIVNTGASWGDYHAVLLERSDCTLFVIDQRASSVRACQHALELCMRMGVATGSFAYALNRCGKRALFTSIDIACALQGAHVYELQEGGSEVEELCGSGCAERLASSSNPFTKSVTEMMADILPGVAMASSSKKRRREARS